MHKKTTAAEQIMRIVAQNPGCLIEELVLACPDLTWNQVFLQVDHLSRTGRLVLSRRGAGLYTVRLADHLKPAAQVEQQTAGELV